MGRYTGKKCRLVSMFWLTAFFFLVEIVVGYVTNSMALVADSFHMLSDMSPKKWSKNTFGWARAEVLGALVNAVFLVALCFSITVEACKRFIEFEPIHNPELIVAVGALGLLVNLIGLCLFHEHGMAHGHSHGGGVAKSHTHLSHLASTDDTDHDDDNEYPASTVATRKASNPTVNTPPAPVQSTHLNMRGVFLHVLADALGSVIVIASAAVVWLTDWEYKYYIDPALSILMVTLILRSVWPLLQESALILLQTVDAIQRSLLEKVDGVLAVHEFHVWQLAVHKESTFICFRCHNLSEYMKIAEKVKEFFHNEGIHSTTIQPEFTEYPGDALLPYAPNEACVLDCPKTDKPCALSTCCGPSKQGRETPSPGDTPYLCRQRGQAGGSSHSVRATQLESRPENTRSAHEVNEMENGRLLGPDAVSTPFLKSLASDSGATPRLTLPMVLCIQAGQ
ncbi:hypothetical protein B566_EDAN006148 [Ephemera danica]|nr:hypothetical protein B566_EDAN006148 [Ephemera danica]